MKLKLPQAKLKLPQEIPDLRYLLMGLGALLMLLALLALAAGLAARQSLQTAELQARDHAAELGGEIAVLQSWLADRRVERAAVATREAGAHTSENLADALREAGFARVTDVQVFDPDLETLGEDDEDNGPDFATLELLLEARRAGQARPEALNAPGRSGELALARRLGSIDQRADGILLIRVPVEILANRVDWSTDLDFVALGQDTGSRHTELWQRGSRPDRPTSSTSVPGTRFSLAWHRSTMAPPISLQQSSILALVGLILLLLGLRGSISMPRSAPKTPRLGVPGSTAAEAESESESFAGEKPSAAAIETISRPDEPQKTPMPVARKGAPEAERSPAADQSESAPASPRPDAAEVEPVQTGIARIGDRQAEPEPLDPEPQAQPELELDRTEEAEAPRETGPALERNPEPELEPESEPDPQPAETPVPAQDAGSARKRASRSDQSRSQRTKPSPVEPSLFSDAGILGRVSAGLDARAATMIGQAIGGLAKDRKVSRMAVARDGRLSGPSLLAGLTQGLRSAGIDVVDLGALPSPALNFAAHALTGQSSIMVSGEHLGGEWNGFRVRLQGETLCGQAVHEILDRIEGGSLTYGNGQLEEVSIIERYLQTQIARFELERPLKVVVDCANGISSLVLPRLLAEIGADVIPLSADVDGAFPNHPPDPSRLENLEDLRLCVRNFHADLGLAIGGDGDRLVMVGPDGEVIWPDRLLLLLARGLSEIEQGDLIVHDALCSPRLEAEIGSMGGRVRATELGTPAVWRAIKEHGGVLGVTFDGQFILPEEGTGAADGLLTACRLLETLAADTRDIDEILGELPSWFSMPAAFVVTRPTPPEDLLNQLLEGADVSDAEVSSEQGFTIDYGHAWARICQSAGGNGLVIRIEGDDEEAARDLALLVRQMLLAVDERLQIPF